MFLRSLFRSLVRHDRQSSGRSRTAAAVSFQPRPIRRLVGGLERLDERLPFAADMEHFQLLMALDVSGDGAVSPLDALQLINHLNSGVSGVVRGALPGGAAGGANRAAGEAREFINWLPARFDINGDRAVTPLDALNVINRINSHGSETISVSNLLGDTMQGLEPAQQTAIDALFQSLNGLRVRSDILPDQIMSAVTRVADLVSQAVMPTLEQLGAVRDTFFASMLDGNLSDSDIQAVSAEVGELIVAANVPQAEVDALIADFTAMYSQIDVNDADLDALLGNVETLVNAFAPNSLDLPSVGQIRQFLDTNIADLPNLLGNLGLLDDAGQLNLTQLLGTAGQTSLAELLGNVGQNNLVGLLGNVGQTNLAELLGNSELVALLGTAGQIDLSQLLGSSGQLNLAALLGTAGQLSLSELLAALTSAHPGANPGSGQASEPTDGSAGGSTETSTDPPVVDPPVVDPGVVDPVVETTPDPVAPPAPPPTPTPPPAPAPDPTATVIAALQTKLGPNAFGGPAGLQQVVSTLLQSYSASDLIAMLNSPAVAPYLPMISSLTPATALAMLANFRR